MRLREDFNKTGTETPQFSADSECLQSIHDIYNAFISFRKEKRPENFTMEAIIHDNCTGMLICRVNVNDTELSGGSNVRTWTNITSYTQ